VSPLGKRQLIAAIRATFRQMTGREYQIDFEQLDDRSLVELHRAVRDLEYEKRAAVNRARLMPWRRF
jgi:hypothetical protein